MKTFGLFLFLTIATLPLLHASEGDVTSEGEVYEEVIEEHEIPDVPAEESGSSASPGSLSSDVASSSLKDEVTFLRAQVVSLRNAVEGLQKNSKTQEISVESQKASPQNDDVTYVMHHVSPEPSARVKKFDAHNEAEATAMEEAEKKAPTLPGGKMQRDFNALQKAYGEVKSLSFEQQKGKLPTFRKLCDAYIKAYETDSSGRSALYYLGHVLFITQHYKESLNVLARVYKGDEEGPHAADALLYMAQIFHKEKNTEAALKFLEKIKKDFRSEYLAKGTKDLFHHVAKELGSKMTLANAPAPVKSVAVKKEGPSKEGPNKASTPSQHVIKKPQVSPAQGSSKVQTA